MSTETTTPPHATGYLLLFRNTQWDRDGYSEDQIRQAMEQTRAWFDRLGASGKLVSAQPLFEDAVIISGKGGRSVTDGPFPETKEAIGGYVLLSVGSMEEAVAIARSNPMHDYGLATEVRATASSCPKLYRLNSQMAGAAV